MPSLNTSGFFQYHNASGVSPYDGLSSALAKHIYLCAHPADAGLQGDLIRRLSSFGQSFYFWTHKEPLPELTGDVKKAYFGDILQNQLFIVLVTSDFLREDDISLEEFAFARDHHMQILPILCGCSLSGAFGRISGSLKALHWDEEDTTRIALEEKLRRYLFRAFPIVASQQEESALQAAFDARIVISYRQADRAFIRPVMAAIHRDPRLRWASVWYDESLNFGEDYHPQIEEEFSRADLAILLLTKSMLQPDNYVVRVEYPFLCEKNIPVLAVTVGDLPLSVYSDFLVKSAEDNGYKVPPLTACVPLEQPEALAGAVRSHLEARALLSDPSAKGAGDLYKLGWAYLTEFLTESNPDYARDYLFAAASKGSHEAYELLIRMYTEGYACKQDLRFARQISEQYVWFLLGGQGLRDQNDEADAIAALSTLCDLAQALPGQGDYRWAGRLADLQLERFRRTALFTDELGYYNALLRYADLRFRERYYEVAGEREGRDARPLQEIYEEICGWFSQLAARVQEASVLSENQILLGHVALRKDEVIRNLNEGYLRSGFRYHKLRALYAESSKERNDALRCAEDLLHRKERYMETGSDWALATLYLDYEEFTALLCEYGFLQIAADLLADHRSYLQQLFARGITDVPYRLSSVKNHIRTGDISESPAQAAAHYRAATAELQELRAEGITDRALEQALRERAELLQKL